MLLFFLCQNSIISDDYWLTSSIQNHSLERELFAYISLQVPALGLLFQVVENVLPIPIHTITYYIQPKGRRLVRVPRLQCCSIQAACVEYWLHPWHLVLSTRGEKHIISTVWKMRARLMAHEMKIIPGAKKVWKCKVGGMACWSCRGQGSWRGENAGRLAFKGKKDKSIWRHRNKTHIICAQVVKLWQLFKSYITSRVLFTWLWRESLTSYG